MSIVYEKSTSSKYLNYFEQTSKLVKSFCSFSLKNQRLAAPFDTKPWEKGMAGVPLAWDQKEEKIAVDHTDSHTLVIGPTGSKKSRLIVMPLVRILGSAQESMIISDPKAEIYNRTASYLISRGYHILVLNLRSPLNGSCWNPLSVPYEFFSRGEVDKAYEFVNDIAENLIQSEKSVSDPFWDNSAGAFFFGLVLLLFKYCKDHNISSKEIHMGNVIGLRNALFSGPDGGKKSSLWKYAKTDPIICSALIGTVETANDTRAGILSMFDQKVRMFLIQPNLMDMLSSNDIDFSIIGQEPTAVFLIVPDEKTSYHRLVSLFIKQSYEYMIYLAQQETHAQSLQTGMLKNRLNYVLDEFSSLPTIRDFPAMVTASRSRNIRFTLIIQSKHQLIQRYGEEAETIQTNCNNWLFLTSRELRLLEDISSLCGKVSNNIQSPVMSVSSLQRLDKDEGEVLLLIGRKKPCIAKLPDIDLYDHKNFAILEIPARKLRLLHYLNFDLVAQSKIEVPHLTPGSKMEGLDQDLRTVLAAYSRPLQEIIQMKEIPDLPHVEIIRPSIEIRQDADTSDDVRSKKGK